MVWLLSVWALFCTISNWLRVGETLAEKVLYWEFSTVVIGYKWKAALYVDESASDDMMEGLEMIFSGQAGGTTAPFRALVRPIWLVLGVL